MRLGIASSLLISLALTACHKAPDGTEQFDSADDPIYGGTLDTSDPAVVALFGNGTDGQFACSGTIIDISSSGTATVVTAAHCCGGETPGDQITDVIVGNNYQTATIDYTPTNQAFDSAYNTNAQSPTHDFCVVQFTADSNTPAPIPAMDPSIDTGANALKAGTAVEFAGFGTTGPSQSGQNNSKKYHVAGTLEQVDSLTVEYSQANGTGPCSGDSGGPAFATVGGTVYMAAVTSYGDQACTQFGVSGRISGDWGWISTFLGGTTSGSTVATSTTSTGGQTCGDCQTSAESGACAGQVDTCFADTDCSSLVDCINNCNGDQTCANNCGAQSTQTAVDDYNAIFTCICDTACFNECATECGNTTSTSSTAATSGTSGVGVGVGSTTTTGSSQTTVGTSGAGGSFGTTTTATGAGGDDTKSDDSGDFGTSKSSCGCRIEDQSKSDFAPLAGLGLALMMVSRRRRRG